MNHLFLEVVQLFIVLSTYMFSYYFVDTSVYFILISCFHLILLKKRILRGYKSDIRHTTQV